MGYDERTLNNLQRVARVVPGCVNAAGKTLTPPGLPLAQTVASELGVPATALTSEVGTSPQFGVNQTPTIDNNGYWRAQLPMAH